jgi:hypothetical protein
VQLVDSASTVAEAVVGRFGPSLVRTGAPGRVHLQLTDASANFLRVAAAILGGPVVDAEVVDIDAGTG